MLKKTIQTGGFGRRSFDAPGTQRPNRDDASRRVMSPVSADRGGHGFRRNRILSSGHSEAAFATAEAPGAAGAAGTTVGIIFATMMLTTLSLSLAPTLLSHRCTRGGSPMRNRRLGTLTIQACFFCHENYGAFQG